MRRPLRTLGVLAALALAGTLLAAGTGTAVARGTDPMVGAPAAGTCYDLTVKQVYKKAAPEAPVDCSDRHTVVVTAVGQLPGTIEWTDIDFTKRFPDAVVRTMNTTCNTAARKLVASDRVRGLTLYTDYWFAPTDAQIGSGARWFSCLLTLNDATRLLPLTHGLPTKITGSVPDKVARCAKSTKRGYLDVACSHRHQWRATFTKIVRLKLTDKALLRAARRSCPGHVPSKRWLYYGEYVTHQSFVVGCMTNTRR